jgi:hypothetical protein
MMTDSFDAAVAEAEGGRFVDRWGHRYDLRDKVPRMPLYLLAQMSARGGTTGSMESLAALVDVIESVFTPESWVQFKRDATTACADEDELLEVVREAIEVINGFPTTPSSGSSDTPSSTTPSSTVSSFEERKRAAGMTPVTPESLRELVG